MVAQCRSLNTLSLDCRKKKYLGSGVKGISPAYEAYNSKDIFTDYAAVPITCTHIG